VSPSAIRSDPNTGFVVFTFSPSLEPFGNRHLLVKKEKCPPISKALVLVHLALREGLAHLGWMLCGLSAVKQPTDLDGIAFDPFSFQQDGLTSRMSSRPEEFHPPGAPRTVREPLDSHGSRCSAVGTRGQRLCLVHGLLPLPDGFSWPVVSAEQRSPCGQNIGLRLLSLRSRI
jgi:hypothetical protein